MSNFFAQFEGTDDSPEIINRFKEALLEVAHHQLQLFTQISSLTELHHVWTRSNTEKISFTMSGGSPDPKGLIRKDAENLSDTDVIDKIS